MNVNDKKTAELRGSGIGKFVNGDEINSIAQLRVGDLLADFRPQFDALNLMKVLEIAEDGSRAYGVFVDPKETRKMRLPGDERFCVWGFEIGRSIVLHRAIVS